MNKIEFINSYITTLESVLQQYCNSEVDENAVFDCIQEIRGVFIRENPEIDDAVWLRNGTAERDANSVIGILKLKIINEQPKDATIDKKQFNKDLKELNLEYNGIKSTIEDYTSDGNILNYVNQLGTAIKSCEIESIKYCLSAMEQWYVKSISSIHSNEFVYNAESHDENKGKIEKFKLSFEKYNGSFISIENKSEVANEPIIFLSHKSDDKKYGDVLERFIISLGVKNNQLIYTSHPLHKIPLDENIYDYLRKNIYSNMFMIILWSDKYLESPACLNEMGAAWVTQSDYTNIYVPSFSFGNPKYRECAVDTSKMGAVLNGDEHCKTSMLELKDKIQRIFSLTNDEKQTMYAIDKFIEEIKEIQN